MQSITINKGHLYLQGGGEMGELTRSFKWSTTKLGNPGQWPLSLHITLGNLLHSGFPMFLFWGEDKICFYNDAFRPSLGKEGKHPAIGKKGKDVWSEIWDFIGPLIEGVLKTGQPVWFENQLVPIYRDGMIQNVYWTFSYSLALDDDGGPGGVLVTCMETTQSVLAQQKLASDEAKLHFALKAGHLGSWELELQTMELNASDICKLNFGQPTGVPFTYQTLREIIHPDDRDYQEQAVTATLTSGADYDVEYRVIWPDGTLHWVNIRGQLQYDKNNQPERLIGVSIDITDRKNSEQKLLESETRFRKMAEGTPVLIGVADQTSNATYFNKAWSVLTGRPMEKLLEHGWIDIIHPEDKEHYNNVYRTAFSTQSPFSGECRVLTANGEYRWLLSHGVPRFNEDGSFAGYISSCIDITENKAILNQLQTALEQVRLSKEAAELGTFDLDLEKGTLHWDDRCRTLFGISHHAPVTYEKDFVEGLHPEDRPRIMKIIDDLFNKAISNGDYDVEYRTVGAEDGVIRWVRAKGKVYFQQEKPVRFIGSVLDITEQVNAIHKIEELVHERTKELALANESLIKANKELQRSNQNLEEFAHAASHDLKEPVRKILFFTDMLKARISTQVEESEVGLLNRIENSTQRMGTLIDDLLVYSHVAHHPPEMEDVDLNRTLQNVVEDLELNILNKKAQISIGKLPVVKGYRRQLQQLFQNLVSNALKYSKADVPPVVSIYANEAVDNGQKYKAITVEDNGIGFEPEYNQKIFQMFARLHTRTQYSGTGVGLSIVKKVVENHKGIIKVESTPDKGSAFTVFLDN